MSSIEETQNIIIKIDKVKNKSTPKKQLEERINQQEERIKYLENIIQKILSKEKEEEEEKKKKEKQDYELKLKEYKIWYTELATETGGINPLILTSHGQYIEMEIVRLLLIKYKSIGGSHPDILKFKNPKSILREIKNLEGRKGSEFELNLAKEDYIAKGGNNTIILKSKNAGLIWDAIKLKI